MAKRRQSFQPISWFWDLYRRQLLEMDPPYQRRSVWNQTYREQFIDTLLLDYPAPAIFLFSRISDTGDATFELVDGKQRLLAVFDFIRNGFPVGDESPVTALRGKSFESFPSDGKVAFFEYDFPVEYLPTNNEQVINDIFNRLNKNMAKLTPQELRHARFSGKFITRAEELADLMDKRFDKQFPRITEQTKRQMKDVEIVASLLLFLEEGPRGYSVLSLDAAFAARDQEWDREAEIVEEFRSVIDFLAKLVRHPEGQFLSQTRFRNQADFYSLFAAVAELQRASALSDDPSLIGARLKAFDELLEDESRREEVGSASEYYDAARSASNDPGARKKRIAVMEQVLSGKLGDPRP